MDVWGWLGVALAGLVLLLGLWAWRRQAPGFRRARTTRCGRLADDPTRPTRTAF